MRKSYIRWLDIDSEIRKVPSSRKKNHFEYENIKKNDQRTASEKFQHEFFYALSDVDI